MGTRVPRIQVTLSPETYERISRISELAGASKSKLISELVDEVSPHLDQMLSLLEAATSVKAEHRGQVRADAEAVLGLMAPHAEEAQAALDLMAAVLTPETEARPPSSNTGVTRGLSRSNRSKRANVQ